MNYENREHRHSRNPNSPRLSRAKREELRRRRRRKVIALRILVFGIIPLLIVSGIVSLISHLIHKNEEANAPVTETPTEVVEETKEVSFLAVGDNMGHQTVCSTADANSGTMDDGNYDFLPFYTHLADDIKTADISYVNQETIIAGDERGILGYPVFNSPEQWARDLNTLGFDLVNGANNHSLDMGVDGIANSIHIWSQYSDTTYYGVYDSQEAADQIPVIEREGIRFALLAYTYQINDIGVIGETYSVSRLEEEKVRSDIAKAKEISDVIIVAAHWGKESDYPVTETQKTFAQLFADLEVDLVVGAHTHLIQPMEWVTGINGNQTLVAYGLGNFITSMDTVDTQLGGMLTLDFVQKEDDVAIENIVWTPLVNHYNNKEHFVIPLSEYTSELNATHEILAQECPDAITTFNSKVAEIMGTDFTINN